MFKIFFATFFIAELIIAFAVILKIYRFNKLVNITNKAVLSSQNSIKIIFHDLRFTFEEFNKAIVDFRAFVHKKKEEYIMRMLKTSLVYGSILCLKGKYKKTVMAYQIFKEIYEGVVEG